MPESKAITPIVLCLSGLDPTGGAGLQADIEAVASMGAHAAAVATCLTVQTTSDVLAVQPVATDLFIEQVRAVLEDMPARCVKIGALASVGVVEAIHSILRDYPDLPVVLDPVSAAGGGTPLHDANTRDAIVTLLLPQTTLLTPNGLEAFALADGADSPEACAMALLERGCDLVLVTGGHEPTPEVVNVLYGNHRKLEEWRWPRLPERYHGSGCTLAAACAGLLAQGMEPLGAVAEAQRYTWETLRHARRLGMGQLIPHRLYWTRDDGP